MERAGWLNRLKHSAILRLATGALLLALAVLTLSTVIYSRTLYGEAARELALIHLNKLEMVTRELDLSLLATAGKLEDEIWAAPLSAIFLADGTASDSDSLQAAVELRNIVSRWPEIGRALFYIPGSGAVYTSEGNIYHEAELDNFPILTRHLSGHSEPAAYTKGDHATWLRFCDNQIWLCQNLNTSRLVCVLAVRIDLNWLKEHFYREFYHDNGSVLLLSSCGERLSSGVFRCDDADYARLSQESRQITPESRRRLSVLRSGNYYHIHDQVNGLQIFSRADFSSIRVRNAAVLRLLAPGLLLLSCGGLALAIWGRRSLYQPLNRLLAQPGVAVEGREPREWNEVERLSSRYMEMLTENARLNKELSQLDQRLEGQLLRQLLLGLADPPQVHKLLAAGNSPWAKVGYYGVAVLSLGDEKNRPLPPLTAAIYQQALSESLTKGDGDILLCCLPLTDTRLLWLGGFSPANSWQQAEAAWQQAQARLAEKAAGLPCSLHISACRVEGSIARLRVAYLDACQQAEGKSGSVAGKAQPEQRLSEYRLVISQLCELVINDQAAEGRLLLAGLNSQLQRSGDLPGWESTLREDFWRQLQGKRIDNEELERELPGAAEADMDWSAYCQRVVELLERCGQRRTLRHCKMVKEIVAQRFSQRDLSLNAISQQLGVTPYYLGRIFNEESGDSFSAYLNKYRVERAKELLRDTSQSVEAVGALCGFNSRQYFSRVFRKYAELSPLEWQLNYGVQQKGGPPCDER